jgi:hypothetical protein
MYSLNILLVGNVIQFTVYNVLAFDDNMHCYCSNLRLTYVGYICIQEDFGFAWD